MRLADALVAPSAAMRMLCEHIIAGRELRSWVEVAEMDYSQRVSGISLRRVCSFIRGSDLELLLLLLLQQKEPDKMVQVSD